MAPRATPRRRVKRRPANPKARRPRRRRSPARSRARADEKRSAGRIPTFVLPCRVSAGRRVLSAYLTDLSPNGARISSDDPLPPAARTVVIEARLSRGLPASALPATVRWRKAGRRSAGEAVVFGITFARLSAGQRALLLSVVREFQRRAALVA